MDFSLLSVNLGYKQELLNIKSHLQKTYIQRWSSFCPLGSCYL